MMNVFRSMSPELYVRGQPNPVSSPCPQTYTLIYSTPVKLTCAGEFGFSARLQRSALGYFTRLRFQLNIYESERAPHHWRHTNKNSPNISLLRKLNNKWRWREDEMITPPNVSPGSELISSHHDRGEDIELPVLNYVIQT